MAFCTNCGAQNDEGSKFCNSCGAPLQFGQPVQPQAQPAQPEYQQPVYQQPVYQQPQVQPVQPLYVQPMASNEPSVKKNGFCTAGFVLSLLGIFLVGTTSLFGLIFSIV